MIRIINESNRGKNNRKVKNETVLGMYDTARFWQLAEEQGYTYDAKRKTWLDSDGNPVDLKYNEANELLFRMDDPSVSHRQPTRLKWWDYDYDIGRSVPKDVPDNREAENDGYEWSDTEKRWIPKEGYEWDDEYARYREPSKLGTSDYYKHNDKKIYCPVCGDLLIGRFYGDGVRENGNIVFCDNCDNKFYAYWDGDDIHLEDYETGEILL